MTDQSVTVPSGGSVVFAWVGHHNVAELKSVDKFTSCELSSAVELSKEVDHGAHSHRRLSESEEEKKEQLDKGLEKTKSGFFDKIKSSSIP